MHVMAMARLRTLGQAIRRAAARMPAGARHHCNICDRPVRRFLPYRGGWSSVPPLSRSLKIVGSDVENFECPACGSHDRERHLLMYLEAKGLLEKMKGAKILHLAPERHLQQFIRRAQPTEYVLGDLHPDKPGVESVDLQEVPYPDDYFDFVIANHVLEHVHDDRKALSEIVRVLRPGGNAILQTPYSSMLTRTFEDPAIETPEACLHAFGQEDHRRLYGRNIARHFESCGLLSRMQGHFELLAGVDPVRHGLNPNEPFFLFEKEMSSSSPPTSCVQASEWQGSTAHQSADATPLVSVLCITYNHEQFIAQALDSILMQGVQFPYEIVVGDDCSMDGTVRVIQEYQARFPGRIKLLTAPFNSGVTQNFRRTMKACQGRYIAICEGDDFWSDANKLATQVQFLERNPEYVITYHDAYVLDPSGKCERLQLPGELQRDASPDELARTRPISTLTVCFRNLLGDIPAEFNHAPVLDLCLWSLLGSFGAGKYLGDIKPAVYRAHAGGVFSTQSERNRLRMTARTYLCLAQYHENRKNRELGGYFAFRAASIIGEQLQAPQQAKMIRNLAGKLWERAKARLSGRREPC